MTHPTFARALAALLVAAGTVIAQPPAPTEIAAAAPAELPMRFVGGRVFLKADLKAKGQTIAAHLLLEIGSAEFFTLHARTAQALSLEAGDDVDVDLKEHQLEKLTPLVKNDRFLEFLTAEYAQELEEIPVVGILGWPSFRTHRVELDFKRNRLRLLPRRAAGPDETAVPAPAPAEPPAPADAAAPTVSSTLAGIAEVGETRIVPLVKKGSTYRFQVLLENDRRVSGALTTAAHDSWVTDTLAAQLGHRAGDLASARLDSLDLTQYAALRPRKDPPVFEDRPDVVAGTGFLSAFRVVVDPFLEQLELTAQRKPVFPKADQECFQALAADDPKPLVTWLEKNKDHRLGTDAALALMNLRLQESPPDGPALEQAVKFLAEATPLKRRARVLLDLVERTRQRAPEAGKLFRKKALDLALEYAGKDDDADAIHKTRSEIGGLLLEEGPEQQKEAWRHLLAAAFGLPRDGMVNLRLGVLYERMGKSDRAWSRFLQASITEDAGPDGLAGLKRLADATGAHGPYDVEEMERALEGRIPAFEPASTYKPKDGKKPERTVLCEVFTGAHCRPCAAADLAFDGLPAHFAGGEVAVIQHHLPIPRPEPLVSEAAAERAAENEVNATPTILLDGAPGPQIGGPPERAGSAFRELREAVEKRLDVATPWRLSIEPASGAAAVANGTLSVRVRIDGPEAKDVTLRAFLCERTVLFPGGNRIVLHRYLTRAELTKSTKPIAAAAGPREALLSAKLADVTGALEEGLDQIESSTGAPFPLRPTRIDEKQVVVVAWLERAGGVLQAASWEANPRPREK